MPVTAQITTITVEEHLARILERVELLAVREVELLDAHGRTLAENVRARVSLPLWDNSAMDGYAVRAIDSAGSTATNPRTLRIVGEVLAGSALDPRIAQGEAVRIMTGAPVPTDADAVIPVELTRGSRGDGAWANDTVDALAPVVAGSNVRKRGEDIAEGDVLAAAGEPLGAARLAALAAAGIERAHVRELPTVAVVVTGSELRGPGQDLGRGQIPESNSVLLAGLLRECGVRSVEVHHSPDNSASLATLLGDLGQRFDVVITTGGIGPGTHDVVRIALESEPDVRAARVAVRPAKLQCAGRLRGGAAVFALSGNPVSAAVSFELFVRPALLAMQGRNALHRVTVPATAVAGWRGPQDRLQVLPVVVTCHTGDPGEPALTCAPAVNPRGVSHAVGGHGAANGYALVAAGTGDVAAGETVTVTLVAS